MKYKEIGDSLYIKGRIGWKGLKKSEYLKNSDYRIINGSNIFDNKIDWSNCGYISEERYNESPEIMLQKGDILITKDGTIGKVAMVSELKKPTTVASGLFVLRNTAPSKWDTKYIFNFLQSNKFKKFVFSRTEGSVIPHLYQKDFMTLEIPELEINEQRKIAYRLDTIQHKLDLNNQINDNLLELAKTIFKNIIKTSSLHALTINDVGTVIGGGTPSKKVPKYWNGNIPWISPKDLSNHPNVFTSHGENSITQNGLDHSSTKLLPQKTVLFSSRAPIGYISIANNEITTNQGFKSVIPDKNYPFWFIYELLKSETPKIINEANGSTFKEISGGKLKQHKISIPTSIEVMKYNSIFLPIFEKIQQFEEEIDKLNQIKDILLNKFF
ncbi:restriction endonuclease subunit S [Lactobacillus paragasseri]|uniref:restriction endonuclease subunit S n=3 Tax=Lactobacillus paragasseri TaxID=2107999 RepID=UPI001E625C41|nr:restriction endonuclease subunit S [Lactobacillus paragasseri]MDX5081161.1 restriction endonuclease subunit S [Lactobacillus paragasseri]